MLVEHSDTTTKETFYCYIEGKIGGGKVGIGKQLFFDNFRGDFETANDDGKDTKFCVIGSMNSKHFPQQVSNFVAEVDRIKNLTMDNEADFPFLLEFKCTDEHSGISKVKRKSTGIIERIHGIVVNSLARILEDNGHKIANNRNVDLFIHKRGQIKTIFEIKTSSSTQDLYSAVGQLLIYSIPVEGNADLFLVLPDKLSRPVEKCLYEHGLQIICYTWNNSKPTFQNFGKLLR